MQNLQHRKEGKIMNLNEPLAYRVRPKTLEEYVGQEHVIGEGKIYIEQ